MMRFHSDDYINFLRIITPDNMHDYIRQLQRCKYLLPSSPMNGYRHSRYLANMQLMLAKIVQFLMAYLSFAHYTRAGQLEGQ